MPFWSKTPRKEETYGFFGKLGSKPEVMDHGPKGNTPRFDDGRIRAPRKPFGPHERGSRTIMGLGKKVIAAGIVLYMCDYAYNYKAQQRTEDAEFVLRKLRVVPYGVMGTQLSQSSREMLVIAPIPDKETCVVDQYAKGTNPSMVSAAANSIYKWAGIDKAQRYPQQVLLNLNKTSDAVHVEYSGDKHIIHVIAPDFREGTWSRPEAVQVLGAAYRNILHEFAVSNSPNLRLSPLSTGPMSGALVTDLPNITMEAIHSGFTQLHKVDKEVLMGPKVANVDLCVFNEREWEFFKNSQRVMKEKV